MATGFKRQSEAPPSACRVELPSKDHSLQSFIFPEKSVSIIVLLRMLCVGSNPSSQIYSNFDLVAIVKVAIIGGLGHIGLPLGILFANKNKNVLLVDSNLEHQDKVMHGKMPFLEYGAEDMLK